MKRLAIAVAATAALTATAAHAATLTIRLEGVASSKGQIMVQACDKASFLKTCAYRAKAPAARGAMTIKLPNVPPGRYAVMAFHDENGDGEMNRNRLGLPTEGTGVSRDAIGDRGPPAFDDAAVDVKADSVVDINLAYF